MTKRISTLPVLVLADLTDAVRAVVYRADGSPARVDTVALGDLRSFVTAPITDHSGSLGSVSARWSALHVDTITAYGGATAVTASAPVFSGTQTWSNAAVVFVAADINIIDSASDANSLLLRLRVGGNPKFSVTKGGVVTATTFVGALTGTASSATVASAVAGTNVTGTTLAPGVVTSSLTALGTVLDLSVGKVQSVTVQQSCLTGAATSIGSALTVNGMYLVMATYPAVPTQTTALVSYDGTNVVIVALSAGSVTITAVGAQLKATQASGSTKTVTLSYLLIKHG